MKRSEISPYPYFGLLVILLSSCNISSIDPPLPLAPVPSARQLAWQDLEFYAFVHFNMNTFTNMEWGTGAEDPSLFNPSELDCDQWVSTFKDAGMKGVIITAKHHDGFCLWPSKYTKHSVKYSPWKDGDGDVIRELAQACAEQDFKLGIYYSPWDRNHADYGTPDYLIYMRRQLKELLTQYGEIFEVWFDGANGGTGYYGGANEDRRVDKLTYYDWERTYELIRQWQPNAVIFSDAGPDVRWIGNENGHSYPTIWSNLMRDSVYGGMPNYHTDWAAGQVDGTHWVPAETNVSIRPGWYYHQYEDHKVKTMPKLVNIYYESIGMNTPLLLNFPVDTRGIVHENDQTQLKRMIKVIRDDFSQNLLLSASVTASNERGREFSGDKVVDMDKNTYWATSDTVINASITLTLDSTIIFNRFLIQEYIPLGQRVRSFSLEYLSSTGWEVITRETTIGYKRILRFDDISSNAIRVSIDDARACPTISNIEAYYAKPILYPPEVSRSQAGLVSMSVPEDNVSVYYEIGDREPDSESNRYLRPFDVDTPANIRAVAIDQFGNESEITEVQFDISSQHWRVIHRDTNAVKIFDGDEQTFWTTSKRDRNRVIIDLGKETRIKGFTYLPPQNRWFSGVISEYALYASNGGKYGFLSKGEFSNIANSPVWQRVEIPEHNCRYIMLRALETLDDLPASFAEIGVLTTTQQ